MLFEIGPTRPDNRVKMTATEAFLIGQLSKAGYLEKILAALSAREGGKGADMLGLLLEQMRQAESRGKTSMGDIRGEGSSLISKVLTLLDIAPPEKETPAEAVLRRMGVISHQVAAYGGRWIEQHPDQLSFDMGQAEFDFGSPEEVELDEHGEYFGAANELGKKLSPSFSSPEAFLAGGFKLRHEIQELKRLAEILWPQAYRDLKRLTRTAFDEFATVSTILNWIAVEMVKGDMSSHCLVETVLTPWPDLSLGRVDRINFRQPIQPANTAVEAVRLAGIADLKKVEIVDWKFREGDGKERRFLDLSNTPQPEDIFQARLYKLGMSLARVMFGDAKEWDPTNCPKGRLVYLMAGKVFEVRTDLADLSDFFKEGIVERMHRIDSRRAAREGGNALMEALRRLLGKPTKRSRPASFAPGQPSMFPRAEEPSKFLALVDDHRKWTGRHDLIEYLSGGKYVLHMRKIKIAADEGKISLGKRFDFDRGGHMHCPLCPINPIITGEEIPSLHVRVDEGLFYCFRCRIGGRVADESGTVTPVVKRNYTQDFGRPTISVLEEDAYALLQESLNKAFVGSVASKYLLKGRGISPKRALSYGAGYGGDPGAFPGLAELWESGYRLNELIDLGIVGLSDAAISSPLIGALRDFGLAESDLARPRELRSGRLINEFPYWSLEGRVTFPIRSITGPTAPLWGFYGRHVMAGRTAKHRIVMPKEGKRGIFNIRGIAHALALGSLEHVYIAKGVLEAIVLERLGFTPAVSILERLPNHALLQVVHLNPREIRLALGLGVDADEAFNKFTDKLTQMGYNGRVVNFSSTFAEKNPEVLKHGFVDFSAWWAGYGRNRRNKKVVDS